MKQHNQTNDAPTFEGLEHAKYVSLTTFRRNGQPVRTPVWIAAGDRDPSLYVFTGAHTGKIKRIRHNPLVELAPCTFRGRVRGPSARAWASILPASEHTVADRALTRKYPIARRLLGAVNRVLRGRRPAAPVAYLRVELIPEAGMAAV